MTTEELLEFKELCEVIIREKNQERHPELMRQFNELIDKGALDPVPTCNFYYVLRLDAAFKVLYMDEESAERWNEAGWMLRSCATNQDAQLAMEAWKRERDPKPGLSIVARRAQT